MNKNEYRSFKRKEIINIASAILNEKIDIISGCRYLSKLRLEVGEEDSELFTTIRAVDSETDDVPIGKAREKCSDEHLEKIDKELDKYVPIVKNDVFKACKRILKRFS